MFDNTPSRLESAHVQRDTTNGWYAQVNISGSDLVIYHDETGSLTADNVHVWAAKYGIGGGTTPISVSYASSSMSSSYALTASFAFTASAAVRSYTSLTATQSLNATSSLTASLANAISFVPAAAVSASWVSSSVYIQAADTASFITASNVAGVVNSSSYSYSAVSASYAPFTQIVQTTVASASWVSASVHITNADSASYVVSASYAVTTSYTPCRYCLIFHYIFICRQCFVGTFYWWWVFRQCFVGK